MIIKNHITNEDVEIDDKSVKEIMEYILNISTNGGSYVCMKQLPSTTDGYFIVSKEWMFNSKDSQLSFNLIESELKNAKDVLSKISKLISV